MSVGLPTIGFKECSGVNGLIKHQETGFLSINEADMGNHLETLMGNNTLRQTFGKNANLKMKEYDQTNVFEQWKTFVQSFI